jgi:hypothetical protein
VNVYGTKEGLTPRTTRSGFVRAQHNLSAECKRSSLVGAMPIEITSQRSVLQLIIRKILHDGCKLPESNHQAAKETSYRRCKLNNYSVFFTSIHESKQAGLYTKCTNRKLLAKSTHRTLLQIQHRKEQAEFIYINMVGRDSSVGIATRYGLECPRTESRWGRDFPHPFRLALGHTQPLIQGYRISFPEGKAAWVWC